MQTILDIRKGGDVTRFHTVPMLRPQSVASHSWGVATILLDLDPNCPAHLIKAALYHDVAEHITGDVSAPTKWRYPELAEILSRIEDEVERDLGLTVELTEAEKARLKFADMTELVLYCCQEYRLGNAPAAEIVIRGVTYLKERMLDKVCRAYLYKLESYVNEVLK